MTHSNEIPFTLWLTLLSHQQIVAFNIQDMNGTELYEFPPMTKVAIGKADAFILVFAADDADSYDQVRIKINSEINLFAWGYVWR